jgi:hypothetical protein
MKTVNNSAGKPYFTQRNNKIKPGSSCNVTSMIIALSAAGWPVESLGDNGEQPEDALMRFINTDAATLNRWKQLDPGGRTPPNEWHEVLALGTNRLLRSHGIDSSPVTFRADVTPKTIIDAVNAGGAVVVSGRFPQKGTAPIDHVVAVVGYREEAQDLISFIIDDPWGDYHTGYANHNGNDIILSLDDFDALIKPQGRACKKWGHIVTGFNV